MNITCPFCKHEFEIDDEYRYAHWSDLQECPECHRTFTIWKSLEKMSGREVMLALLDGKTLIEHVPGPSGPLEHKVWLEGDDLVETLNGKRFKGSLCVNLERVSIEGEEKR